MERARRDGDWIRVSRLRAQRLVLRRTLGVVAAPGADVHRAEAAPLAAGATTPVDAVRSMLAIQGQDLRGAKWSVGLRTGATEREVDADLDAGRIVRSWPLRGTLHLVAAEDVEWLLSLTAPRQLAGAASRRRDLGITDLDLERAEVAVRDALVGGASRSRRDLIACIAAAGVGVDGQRGYHLLWHLALRGVLVQGATEGRDQAFHLLDEWLGGHGRRLGRDEALAELSRRYFRSHGPATDTDLARWAGIGLVEARRGREAAGSVIASAEIDGAGYHFDPAVCDRSARTPSEEPVDARARRVLLLPGFDEYLLGYADRSAALAREDAPRVAHGGTFRATVVVDGRVAGTWRATPARTRTSIAVEPFTSFDATVRDGIVAEAERFGRFLGRSIQVESP